MLEVTPVAAFSDNYIWIIKPDYLHNKVYVVDPGDSQVVISYLKQKNLLLEGVFITHHHHDHTGGVAQLCQLYQNIKVWGYKGANIRHINERLVDNSLIRLSDKIIIRVLEVPGHTLDHIAYFLQYEDNGTNEYHLFCGDTLFSAGCGKVFEGTSEQLYRSLLKLARLPHETKIYCAHEYTINNMKFAEWIEPNNKYLSSQLQHVQKLRKKNMATLPTILENELQINPFLRVSLVHIKKRIAVLCNKSQNQLTDVEVFSLMRKLKDSY